MKTADIKWNTTCHYSTGVMVSDNVDIPFKIKQPFPVTIVNSNINNVYTVFLINLMLF